jgi:hypothetical protein
MAILLPAHSLSQGPPADQDIAKMQFPASKAAYSLTNWLERQAGCHVEHARLHQLPLILLVHLLYTTTPLPPACLLQRF